MTQESMSVDAFVSQYSSFHNQTSRDAFIQKIKKRSYVPVLEKYAILQLVNEQSVRKMENGVQYIDMFASRMNFRNALLTFYTTLTVDKDEQGTLKVAEAYDLLKKNKLWEKIDEMIGEDELTECLNINQMIMDTWHEQHSTTHATVMEGIDHAVRTFSMMTDDGMKKLADIAEDPVKAEKAKGTIINLFEKVKK